MQVDLLIPDAAPPRGPFGPSGSADAGGAGAPGGDGFAKLVDAAGAILGGAERAEAAFVAHRGGLQEMVVERARADVALQIAATAAQRTAQSLTTLLGMQL
jgi:hypothetical protein